MIDHDDDDDGFAQGARPRSHHRFCTTFFAPRVDPPPPPEMKATKKYGSWYTRGKQSIILTCKTNQAATITQRERENVSLCLSFLQKKQRELPNKPKQRASSLQAVQKNPPFSASSHFSFFVAASVMGEGILWGVACCIRTVCTCFKTGR